MEKYGRKNALEDDDIGSGKTHCNLCDRNKHRYKENNTKKSFIEMIEIRTIEVVSLSKK